MMVASVEAAQTGEAAEFYVALLANVRECQIHANTNAWKPIHYIVETFRVLTPEKPAKPTSHYDSGCASAQAFCTRRDEGTLESLKTELTTQLGAENGKIVFEALSQVATFVVVRQLINKVTYHVTDEYDLYENGYMHQAVTVRNTELAERIINIVYQAPASAVEGMSKDL